MSKRRLIMLLTAGASVVLVVGCRRVTLVRQVLVPPVQRVPSDIKNIAILPFVIDYASPELKKYAAFPPEVIEGKIAERLQETKPYKVTWPYKEKEPYRVSFLRTIAVDIPNYRQIIDALINQGIVDPDLKKALEKIGKGTLPDAILVGSIFIQKGKRGIFSRIFRSSEGGAGGNGQTTQQSTYKTEQVITESTPIVVTVLLVLLRLDNGAPVVTVQPSKKVSIGDYPKVANYCADVFIQKITPSWRLVKIPLFYNSKETEAICHQLRGIGSISRVSPKDVLAVQESLEGLLAKKPDDDCALFLMGMTYELLCNWEKAKEYYMKAIGSRPRKEYSDALTRVVQAQDRIRKAEEERRRLQAKMEELEKEKSREEEFRPYKNWKN